MNKWRKRLAKTSANFPTKGSFYSWYIYTSMSISYCCNFVFKDNEFKLIVAKYEDGNMVELLKEYPHEIKYMKDAKKFVEKLI